MLRYAAPCAVTEKNVSRPNIIQRVPHTARQQFDYKLSDNNTVMNDFNRRANEFFSRQQRKSRMHGRVFTRRPVNSVLIRETKTFEFRAVPVPPPTPKPISNCGQLRSCYSSSSLLSFFEYKPSERLGRRCIVHITKHTPHVFRSEIINRLFKLYVCGMCCVCIGLSLGTAGSKP